MIYEIKQWFLDLFRGVPLGAVGRSNQWPKVRAKYLKENPDCATCGKKRTLLKPNEVHHVVPFSQNRSLELSEYNLITLCYEHHLFIGHLNSWRSWNPEVRENSGYFLNRIKTRP